MYLLVTAQCLLLFSNELLGNCKIKSWHKHINVFSVANLESVKKYSLSKPMNTTMIPIIMFSFTLCHLTSIHKFSTEQYYKVYHLIVGYRERQTEFPRAVHQRNQYFKYLWFGKLESKHISKLSVMWNYPLHYIYRTLALTTTTFLSLHFGIFIDKYH